MCSEQGKEIKDSQTELEDEGVSGVRKNKRKDVKLLLLKV